MEREAKEGITIFVTVESRERALAGTQGCEAKRLLPAKKEGKREGMRE